MHRRMFLTTALAIIVAPKMAQEQSKLLRVWADGVELRPDEFIFDDGRITLTTAQVGRKLLIRYNT